MYSLITSSALQYKLTTLSPLLWQHTTLLQSGRAYSDEGGGEGLATLSIQQRSPRVPDGGRAVPAARPRPSWSQRRGPGADPRGGRKRCVHRRPEADGTADCGREPRTASWSRDQSKLWDCCRRRLNSRSDFPVQSWWHCLIVVLGSIQSVWWCLHSAGAVIRKLEATLRLFYRKLVLPCSGSVTLRRAFLAAVLLYMLLLRIDPGWNKCSLVTVPSRLVEVQNIWLVINLPLVFLQRFRLHLCGFPNFFSCSNRCGGPCLLHTIRLSLRKDCKGLKITTHIFSFN